MKTDAPSVVVADHPCAVCGARLDALHVDQGLGGTFVCSFCGAPQTAARVELRAPPNGEEAPMSLLETGQVLRDARERRDETLEDAAAATGIRPKYIHELEDGSTWFDRYPGRVYGRFFLRGYAEHLGIDAGPLVAAFDRESPPTEALEPDVAPIRRPHRSWSTALVVLVALVVSLGWAATLRGSVDVPSDRPAVTVPAPGRLHAGAPHAPADHAPSSRIRAVVSTTAASWIDARSDGRTVYRATSEPGVVLTVTADRLLEMTLGDAGAVSLEVNGRRVPTGARGAVVHIAFELRDGRIRSIRV